MTKNVLFYNQFDYAQLYQIITTETRNYAMPKIRFVKNYAEIHCPEGSNLMRTLLDAGIPVASSCDGDGICKKCKVTISNGDDFKNLTQLEILAKEMNELKPNQRLACQVSVFNDLTVDTGYW